MRSLLIGRSSKSAPGGPRGGEDVAPGRDAAGNITTYAGGSAFRLTLSTERPPAPTITFPSPDTDFPDRVATVSGGAAGNATRVRISGSNTVTVDVGLDGSWSGAVSLPQGPSRIRAVALSAAGATSDEASVAVTAAGTRRITVVGGDAQLGTTGGLLPQRLAVRVTTLAGTVVPDVPVTFRIVAEPVPGDGSLDGSGETATSPTLANGEASVSLTLANGENDEDGVMQPTVVEVSVPELAGGPAVLSALGLLPSRAGGNGVPTSLIPLGRDCRTVPGLPVGTCPLVPVDTTVPGFAVVVLDQDQRLLADADVDFVATRGDFGPTATTTVRVRTGPDGIARSGPFHLTPTIQNTEGYHVMLREDDLAATPVQFHLVTARLAAAPSVSMGFAAYAHAGPPAAVRDVSPGSEGGAPETPAEDAIIARVEDAHGNAVANATVTYSVLPTGVAADPGARVFRSDPSASSASRCDFVLTHRADNCAVETLSATTFSAGTAWTQVALGKRASAGYVVRVSAGGGAFADVVRSSEPVVGASAPGEIGNVLQTSSTAAARFAIVGTENDDSDPITAVMWGITCDTVPAENGSSVCGGTFSAARQMDKTVTFTATGGAEFNPSSAVTGVQTSVDGFGRVPVADGEVAAFLVGGESPGNLSLTFSSNPVLVLAGAQKAPVSGIEIIAVTPVCASEPAMTSESICRAKSVRATTKCRKTTDKLGIRTYIDRANGYTENNVLKVTVVRPSGVPKEKELVQKFSLEVRALFETDDYLNYDPERGAAGIPGLYKLSDLKTPLPRGEGGFGYDFSFSEGMVGCIELIAKSYKALSSSPSAEELVSGPRNQRLSLVVPDLPGSVLAEAELKGTPNKAGTLPGAPGPFNWADEITRQGNTRCADNTVCPDGIKKPDGVADWVQMRAWDFYQLKLPGDPQFRPAGGVPEPTTGQVGRAIMIAVGEPKEVFDQVDDVQSTLKSITNKRLAGYSAATVPRRNDRTTGATSHHLWTVSPQVTFNMFRRAEREDGPEGPEVADGGSPIFWSGLQATTSYSTKRSFLDTAAHEARHAWQLSLLVQSNPEPPPPVLTYSNDESPTDPPRNRLPDNNDDDDCLPERAQLFGKPDHSDKETGSGGELLDSPDNREFAAKGEKNADDCFGVDAELLVPSAYGTVLQERDASRFAAGILREDI